MINDSFISLTEYAKIHNVSPDTVRQKILRGNLHAEKIGKMWIISPDEPYIDHRRKMVARLKAYESKLENINKKR